jgi:hypothetical protein
MAGRLLQNGGCGFYIGKFPLGLNPAQVIGRSERLTKALRLPRGISMEAEQASSRGLASDVNTIARRDSASRRSQKRRCGRARSTFI